MQDNYCYQGGISSFVEFLNKEKEPIHDDIIHFSCTAADNNSTAEVAMQYNDTYNELMLQLCQQHPHHGRRHP